MYSLLYAKSLKSPCSLTSIHITVQNGCVRSAQQPRAWSSCTLTHSPDQLPLNWDCSDVQSRLRKVRRHRNLVMLILPKTQFSLTSDSQLPANVYSVASCPSGLASTHQTPRVLLLQPGLRAEQSESATHCLPHRLGQVLPRPPDKKRVPNVNLRTKKGSWGTGVFFFFLMQSLAVILHRDLSSKPHSEGSLHWTPCLSTPAFSTELLEC